MSQQPENTDPFVDEVIDAPMAQADRSQPEAGAERTPTAKERRAENLKQTFGQGPGLIAIIAVVVIVLVFLGLAIRGFSKTTEQAQGDASVQQPNIPGKNNDVQVSPEELARRQQIAAEEAGRAAQSGESYQPGFDMQVGNGQQNFDANGEFRLGIEGDQRAQQAHQPTSAPASGVQLSAEQAAEINRIEAQRKATEEERQRLQAQYNQQIQQRDQFANSQRELVMAQIDSIFKGYGGNGVNTTVSYLPVQNGGNGAGAGGDGQNGGQTGGVQDVLSSTGGILQMNANGGSSSGGGQTGCNPVFRTGNTAFAVLDHEVNTDAGTHAIATVMGGPYNGSKVIGNVQISHNNVALRFNRLAPQDGRNTLNIDALAMRTSDASTGVATSINRHTISRYTALIFSSALSGLGVAASQQQGSVTQLNNGTTVATTEPATDRQIIGNVLGQVGQTMSGEIAQGVNRPVTYKVARGTGVALFFMNDVCAQ